MSQPSKRRKVATARTSAAEPHPAEADLVAAHGGAEDDAGPGWQTSDPAIIGVMAVSNMNRVRNRFGHVYDARIRADGYRMVKIDGENWLHHLLVHYKKNDQSADQVDHVNHIKHDNRPSNLRNVSAADNVRHSYANPERLTCSEKRSRPIIGTKHGVTSEFSSLSNAARELTLSIASISSCCRTPGRTVAGWSFEYRPDPDLEDEVWKTIQEMLLVSTLGRVQTPGSIKHFPRPRRSGYCDVQINGQKFQLHRLICQAFHGPPPDGYQADHVNRNRADNRAVNLQWLSPQANSARALRVKTTSSARTIEVTATSGQVTRYESLIDAAAGEQLHKCRIAELCRTGGKSNVGRSFAYVVNPPLPGEIFKNITRADLDAIGRQARRDLLVIK